MKDHSNLVLGILVIWAVVIGFFAFQNKQKMNAARTRAIRSQTVLANADKKSENLVSSTGKGVIYLAPKGAKEKKDGNAEIIKTILKKTFAYSSPEDFKIKAEYVKPRVTGTFYSYWFKTGIEHNYQYMKTMANGRKYKRFYRKLQLTKYDNTHFMAIVETGVAMSDTDEDDVQPDLFILLISRTKDGKWEVDKTPNASTYSAGNYDE